MKFTVRLNILFPVWIEQVVLFCFKERQKHLVSQLMALNKCKTVVIKLTVSYNNSAIVVLMLLRWLPMRNSILVPVTTFVLEKSIYIVLVYLCNVIQDIPVFSHAGIYRHLYPPTYLRKVKKLRKYLAKQTIPQNGFS